jgi:PAS domain S-box-containing protein
MNISHLKYKIPWIGIFIFIGFSVIVVTGEVLFYRSNEKENITKVENELASAISLKVGLLAQWRKERLGDGNLISNNDILNTKISECFKNKGQAKEWNNLIVWMKQLVREYDYQSVLLLDVTKKVRISFPRSDSLAGEVPELYLPGVFKEKSVQLTDLHRSSNVPNSHLDLLVPLMINPEKERTLIGYAILRIDATKVFFPLIQAWPSPGKSSETFLIRKEGDSVLFMNELLYRKDASLKLKFSLSENRLPAAMAVKGFEGPFEGSDYRNIPVISYLRKVPDSPWFMVAKVDKSEVLDPLRSQIILISIIAALLILSAGSVIGFLWRTNMARYYKEKLNLEKERTEIQEDLRKSERLYQSLFENMLNGLAYCEMHYDEKGNPSDFTYLAVNGSFEARTGLQNVVGKRVSEVIPGFRTTDRELLNRYGRVAKDGQTDQFEVFVKSLEMWFQISVYCPKQGYFMAVFDVITERKLAEKSLKESEGKFRNLFEQSPVGKSMTGIDGTLYVNRSFCEITGYSAEDLKSKSWRDITHPDDIKITEELIDSLLNGEKGRDRFEKRFMHKTGRIIWTDVSTYLQRDNDGNPLYFITTIYDITERKIAEAEIYQLNKELEDRVSERTAQLEDTNKELESFCYSVSHDLRAPLRAVHGFTRILQEDFSGSLDEEGRRICGIIETNSVHMGYLIDDLLAFSRVGRTELHYSTINMTALLKSIYSELKTDYEDKSVNFEVSIIPPVYGDENTLRIALTNLLSNALKYSSKMENPSILAGYEKVNGNTLYYVKDNGVGFDMKYLPKLFGVFQRLHSQKEFEGNGVGLAIVQRIIIRHGGHVWAEAEVGKGATFYFTLPGEKS